MDSRWHRGTDPRFIRTGDMGTQDSGTPISPERAASEYGVSSKHERMPNGELRFRLLSDSGDGYARTVASPESGWQNSHSHQTLKETYIVQKQWMIIVSLREGSLIFAHLGLGELLTVEPNIPHTVYLPDGAVVHTVKHGATHCKDWNACPELDDMIAGMSESGALAIARSQCNADFTLDPKFESYVNIYNNLDSIIWRLPAFFVTAVALFMAFLGSMMSQGHVLSSLMWAVLLVSVGVLCLLGAYSMWRLRVHHTRMGIQLRMMESSGYFHVRSGDLAHWFPRSAPPIFVALFLILGAFFLILGVLALQEYVPLIDLLKRFAAE